MRIGTFREDKEGYLHGKIHALGIGVVNVILEPVTSRDGKSYYRILSEAGADSFEIGRAFKKQKDGMSYFSVAIDSPSLSAPLNAALFPDKEQNKYFYLVWNRPEPMTLNSDPKPKANGNSRKNIELQPAP